MASELLQRRPSELLFTMIPCLFSSESHVLEYARFTVLFLERGRVWEGGEERLEGLNERES